MGQQHSYEFISNEITDTFFEPFSNNLIEEHDNDFSLFQKLLDLEARILNESELRPNLSLNSNKSK